MHSKLDNILLCPTCRKSGLSRSEKHYICDSCKTEYPDYKGIATIIVPGDRREDYGKLLVMGDNSKRWKHEAKWDSQIESLIPDGGGFFLDLACGGGRKEWVESKGYDYIGLDYYLDFGVSLLADGTNVPLKDNVISVCTSIAVMEHMPDPWTACDELFRVLKPGGLYVGSTTFLYPFHERSYYNMTHLGVRHMLEKSGFVVEKILPWRISGLEALVRVLFVGRVLKQFVSSIARLEFKLIMSLRRIGAKLAARIYSKNERKSQRASQFMDEEPMRFTSGFIYLARKPGSPESIE
jgi:ubiquinone/menaquinone biosynthesis C-methylase UbiE